MKTCYELFGIESHPGWERIVTPLIEACKAQNITIVQIKEKFGGLRFYVGPAPDWLHKLIDRMEELSYHVCEKCGKEGKLRQDRPWVLTLCDECVKDNDI